MDSPRKEQSLGLDQGQSQGQNNIQIPALFVGQIVKDNEGSNKYQDEFIGLMQTLSDQFEATGLPEALVDHHRINPYEDRDNEVIKKELIQYLTSCICNYNYYDVKEELGYYEGNEHEKKFGNYGNMLLRPCKWAEGNREACIKIVNHALEISGYKQYLDRNQGELASNYKICCSVNYYYDRSGAVRYHQDSFGREMFVLLIYLPEVHGPEVQLKNEVQFNSRIEYLQNNQLMPTCFINRARDLYTSVKNGEIGLIKGDAIAPEDLREFYENFKQGKQEWVKKVQGPGGIVGFVDELMIHSTPYLQRRESNRESLLRILDKMQTNESTTENTGNRSFTTVSIENRQRAIDFLRATIKDSTISAGEHYITIDEFWSIIGEQRDKIKVSEEQSEEVIETVLNELYNNLGKLEVSGQGGDGVLGYSEHDLYTGGNTDQTEKSFLHTGSRPRSVSQSIINGSIPQIDGSSGRRSFLRVWVTALPKEPIYKKE